MSTPPPPWWRSLAAPVRILLSALLAAALVWLLDAQGMMPAGTTGQAAATVGLFVFIIFLVEALRLLLRGNHS